MFINRKIKEKTLKTFLINIFMSLAYYPICDLQLIVFGEAIDQERFYLNYFPSVFVM